MASYRSIRQYRLGTTWHKPFLQALLETGSVILSRKKVDVDKCTLYMHRDKYPDFKAAWDEAMDEAVDLLEQEAMRRAVEGVDKPVFYQGELVGHIREYSDALLMFLLRGKRPSRYAHSQQQHVIEHKGVIDSAPEKVRIIELHPVPQIANSSEDGDSETS